MITQIYRVIGGQGGKEEDVPFVTVRTILTYQETDALIEAIRRIPTKPGTYCDEFRCYRSKGRTGDRERYHTWVL
jgi:hypothetical protein